LAWCAGGATVLVRICVAGINPRVAAAVGEA
jgi:hypothetical protein